MKNPILLIAGMLLATTSILAQDTAPVGETETIDANELAPAAEPACFIARDVRNFDALDDRFVFVEGRRGEAYLLTMAGTCIDLRNSPGIAIQSDASRVCSTSGAQIRYRDMGRRQTCLIRRVEAVEDKAAAERLIETRRR